MYESFKFIGGLSTMPAVRTFALYATVALFLDFIFQISAFVALMAIDQKRVEVNDFGVIQINLQ
jgi:Niemann-Pick C1 protein